MPIEYPPRHRAWASALCAKINENGIEAIVHPTGNGVMVFGEITENSWWSYKERHCCWYGSWAHSDKVPSVEEAESTLAKLANPAFVKLVIKSTGMQNMTTSDYLSGDSFHLWLGYAKINELGQEELQKEVYCALHPYRARLDAILSAILSRFR